MITTLQTLVILGICFFIGILIFFKISYSKLNSHFNQSIENYRKKSEKIPTFFNENDLAKLPPPVKQYFVHCGYIGKPKMASMKVSCTNVDFRMENKLLTIDYTLYSFLDKPARFAFIKTSLFGIPFQGLDSYEDGLGGMKGVLGKLVTLFNQGGEKMDQACLATFLSECLVFPNAALQKYITWEEIDSFHAKATIFFNGLSASGIFTFDENGLVRYFETDDRYVSNSDGSMTALKWTALFSNYVENDGILQPKEIQAAWNYPDKDVVYFSSSNALIEFQ